MRFMTLMLFCLAAAFPLRAEQNPFSPAVLVNDHAITRYDVAQRTRFLALLRTPGDLPAQALQALIDDRLRLDEAKRLGLSVTPEQIDTGIAEFAARAQLPADEFIKALVQGGVDAQSFRDFVTAGLVWREVIRARFGTRATVTESEIDRALSLSAQGATVRVLLSELIIPAPPDQTAEAEALARQLAGSIRSEADFAAAARQYSASPSRDRGGVIDWIPLTNLPPQIAQVILGLKPGQVTPPIAIPNAIALFQLRAIEALRDASPGSVTVDYAQYLIAGGRSAAGLAEAARVRAAVDVCNDLYGVAQGLPEAQLSRTEQTMDQVPRDIGIELAKLDEGESSVALERGGALVFLMLCKRQLVADPPADRDAIRGQLVNQKLNGLSDAYLAELVADAHIVTP